MKTNNLILGLMLFGIAAERADCVTVSVNPDTLQRPYSTILSQFDGLILRFDDAGESKYYATPFPQYPMASGVSNLPIERCVYMGVFESQWNQIDVQADQLACGRFAEYSSMLTVNLCGHDFRDQAIRIKSGGHEPNLAYQTLSVNGDVFSTEKMTFRLGERKTTL